MSTKVPLIQDNRLALLHEHHIRNKGLVRYMDMFTELPVESQDFTQEM